MGIFFIIERLLTCSSSQSCLLRLLASQGALISEYGWNYLP